jgi:glycosyltransferase involved in cell wall biosynthesis
MAQPEISILVSSFERPGHVRRVLASIAAQKGVRGSFEVIVTDDGSRDHTPRLVRDFAASVSFPVRFTTHPHTGFHIARCRNEGVAASTAPYLLFLDGDCLMPPGHLQAHLDRRRDGFAMAGYPIYLSQEESQQISADDVADGRFAKHPLSWPRLEMRWRHIRGLFYTLIRDPQRPKLLGGNLGIARQDYERVNGYDENFFGWGCEDDDLRLRLRAAGVTVASIAWWTNTYHMWHPKTPSAPITWRAGSNVEYFRRPLRLTHCMAGLAKRRLQDLNVRLAGKQKLPPHVADVLPAWCRIAYQANRSPEGASEIELAIAPSAAVFSENCDCRVLVIPPGETAPRHLVRQAQLVFGSEPVAGLAADRLHPLESLDRVLPAHLGAAPFSAAALRAAA